MDYYGYKGSYFKRLCKIRKYAWLTFFFLKSNHEKIIFRRNKFISTSTIVPQKMYESFPKRDFKYFLDWRAARHLYRLQTGKAWKFCFQKNHFHCLLFFDKRQMLRWASTECMIITRQEYFVFKVISIILAVFEKNKRFFCVEVDMISKSRLSWNCWKSKPEICCQVKVKMWKWVKWMNNEVQIYCS